MAALNIAKQILLAFYSESNKVSHRLKGFQTLLRAYFFVLPVEKHLNGFPLQGINIFGKHFAFAVDN